MDVNVINAEEFSLCCVETAALNDFIGIIYNTAAFKMIAGSIHVKMWKDKRWFLHFYSVYFGDVSATVHHSASE